MMGHWKIEKTTKGGRVRVNNDAGRTPLSHDIQQKFERKKKVAAKI
jgi:hypothetical protein